MHVKISACSYVENALTYLKQCRKLKLSAESWSRVTTNFNQIDQQESCNKTKANQAADRWGECNNIKNSEFGGECLKQKQPTKQKGKTTTG